MYLPACEYGLCGVEIDNYADSASGVVAKIGNGVASIVNLNPVTQFAFLVQKRITTRGTSEKRESS